MKKVILVGLVVMVAMPVLATIHDEKRMKPCPLKGCCRRSCKKKRQ